MYQHQQIALNCDNWQTTSNLVMNLLPNSYTCNRDYNLQSKLKMNLIRDYMQIEIEPINRDYKQIQIEPIINITSKLKMNL